MYLPWALSLREVSERGIPGRGQLQKQYFQAGAVQLLARSQIHVDLSSH